MSKSWQVGPQWGLTNLHCVDQPESAREPGPGEVRIRLRAVSLNFRDWLVVEGKYNPKFQLPLVPCSDGVGMVEAVGEGVDEVAIGDRVAGLFAQGWQSGSLTHAATQTTLGGPLPGLLRQQVVLPAEGVIGVPAYLSDAQAATLPCAALTAYNALFSFADLQPGETVLLLGTGGVSMFALQFAKAAGAKVIITSSSDEKLEVAGTLGADGTVNYRTHPDWAAKVKEQVGRGGVDVVVETGGGGTLAGSLSVAGFNARIAVLGVLAGRKGEIDVAPIFHKRLRIEGIFVGHKLQFIAMNRFLETHNIQPLVGKTFACDDSVCAFKTLAQGSVVGKIVIQM